jgi:large subunit ribosomal protein L11
MKIVDKFFSAKKDRKKKEKDTDFIRILRLAIPAQNASIAPPLGPALGQFGLNIVEFCKQFNERTKIYDKEVILNVNIFLFRSKAIFKFNIKPPTSSFLLYEYYNFIYFQNNVNEEESFTFNYPSEIPIIDFYKIALYKKKYSGLSFKNTVKILKATYKSMNIKIL